MKIISACLALATGLVTGCRTADSTTRPDPTATVLARNQDEVSLGRSILDVFVAEGYAPVQNSRAEYVFEKPAGALNNIAYGGLLDSSVWLRVVVRIRALDESTHQLTADAYRVRDRGGSLEEQDHLGRSHARRYRSLLRTVAGKP